tara:strand:+ start:936 stop:1901 length:966 start_codon:yes stop_codon:yes gene_type:complete
MANYLSDRTGVQIDTVLDDADAGNIGKTTIPSITQDYDTITQTGFFTPSNSSPNAPATTRGVLVNISGESSGHAGQIHIGSDTGKINFRSKFSVYRPWQELYHTGNTGSLNFGTGAPTIVGVKIDNTIGKVSLLNTGTTSLTCVDFRNGNGAVGNIQTNGTATSFNTSSDPRLKDFKDGPTDSAINDKFDDLFSTFKTFNWKNDADGELVWGFDAHACIDAKLDLGSEGEGPRDLNLGDVYETTPAVFEDKEQPAVYKKGEKKGEQKFYTDGEPVMETVQVEITAAIEKKVSPAGVDQSKAVPILLAKIEQLERRLTAAGL